MEPGADELDESIDRWMRERSAPPAPPAFTAGVMERVRQEHWRAERHWDLGFNIALAAGLLLIVGGVLGLAYASGLAAVARDALVLFGTSLTAVAEQVAPHLPTYAGAFSLTVSGLGLWWWVENA